MQIALREGREIANTDADGTLPVAVISKSLARRYFPDDKPLGKKLKVGPADNSSPWLTIVGIVDDVHYSWIDKNEVPTIYRPYRQSPPYYASLALRTGGEPLSFVPAVRSQVAAVDPELALFDIHSMSERIDLSLASRRTSMLLANAFGGVALFLASLGIYGVLAYLVAQRTREIGIRVALGSSRAGILRLVLQEGFKLVAMGFVLGIVGAALLQKGVASQIYGVRPYDPVVLAGVMALLAGIALVACAVPARRAMGVDPVVVLRYE